MSDIVNDAIVMYDDAVRNIETGAKWAEIREGLRAAIRDRIDPKDARDLAADAVLARVNATRGERAKSLRRNLETILDALALPEDGVYIDPQLDLAYRTGDEAGIDKTLRYWSITDFNDLILRRYRTGRDAMTAAGELDTAATRAMDLMKSRGVMTFGEAFA